MDHDLDDWSPADYPYAIAVTESQFAFRSAGLAVMRIHGPADFRTGFDSRQLDARTLIKDLVWLLNCERLEQQALDELGIDQTFRDTLASARAAFEHTLPGIRDMRHALEHFDEWSRGEGRGPQRLAVRAGATRRDAARTFWGFGYDPHTDKITSGPHSIDVGRVEQAAHDLATAIYMAARAVDAFTTAIATNEPNALRDPETLGAGM